MMRQSRLHRKLGLAPGQGMTVFYTDKIGEFLDHQITAISMHRGGNNVAGFSAGTLQVDLGGRVETIGVDSHCYINLTSNALSALAKLGLDTTGVQRRWTGRIGRQSIKDDATRPSTTVEAAGWAAQSVRAKNLHTPTDSMDISNLLTAFLAPPELMGLVPIQPAGTFDVVAATVEPQNWESSGDQWTTDLGILVAEERGGILRLLTLDWMKRQVESTIGVQVPLTRSQAVSPASWEQATESVRGSFQLLWIDESRAERVTKYGRQTGSNLAGEDEVDRRYVRSRTPQLDLMMKGRVARELDGAWQIPSIRINLLSLLASPHSLHRQQVTQLLNAEIGDPVLFSADWPHWLRGAHIITGLDETITADTWEMTLSLSGTRALWGGERLTIPPMSWDSATGAWDSATTTWN